MFNSRYGILIATRNRVEQLNELLLSITNLILKPERVVISYSGENPYERIKGHEESLNIELIENIKPGQVSQKKMGLLCFGNEVDWIMFCDDDITLAPNCVTNMFDVISKHENSSKIGGAGFSVGQDVKKVHSLLEKIGRAIFCLSTHPPGIVRFNGYNTSYIQERSVIYTSWLNSASIWRREIAKNYDVPLENVAHALTEDLIFSHSVSHRWRLIYNPNAVINLQKKSEETMNESQLRYEQLYHNLYFVLLNSKLSKIGYFWRSLGRLIKIARLDTKKSFSVKSDLRNLFDVLKLILTNKSAKYVYENRIRNL